MTPRLPTQLPLPLELPPVPPPLQPSGTPSISPKEVWQTIDQGERTRIRLIWVQVLEGVSDERR